MHLSTLALPIPTLLILITNLLTSTFASPLPHAPNTAAPHARVALYDWDDTPKRDAAVAVAAAVAAPVVPLSSPADMTKRVEPLGHGLPAPEIEPRAPAETVSQASGETPKRDASQFEIVERSNEEEAINGSAEIEKRDVATSSSAPPTEIEERCEECDEEKEEGGKGHGGQHKGSHKKGSTKHKGHENQHHTGQQQTPKPEEQPTTATPIAAAAAPAAAAPILPSNPATPATTGLAKREATPPEMSVEDLEAQIRSRSGGDDLAGKRAAVEEQIREMEAERRAVVEADAVMARDGVD